MTSDVKMQNFLADVTDAMLTGEDLDTVRRRHGMLRHDHDELVTLIRQLDEAMVPHQPSAEFSRRLKADLLDDPKPGVILRLRGLPARVQMAAAATVFGGFVLFLRRRFFGTVTSKDEKSKEEARVLR